MAEETTTRTTFPKTVSDIEAITEVPTTEGTASFARFINKHLSNASNFQPISEAQAWALVALHRVWQSSDERAEEKEALKQSKSAEKEEKAAARAQAKAERDRAKAEKAAEKERKAAEKAAKEAAEADSDEDLDAPSEGEGEIPSTKRRRRPRASSSAGESAEAI